MRKYRNRIIVSVLPVIFALICIVIATRHYYVDPDAKGIRYNLGTDLAGGSVLVYELNMSREAWEQLTPYEKEQKSADKMVGPLKKRIDPNNLLEITIRPIAAAPPQVEIVVPYKRSAKGQSGDKQVDSPIDQVKNLVTRAGNLEFRIQAYRENRDDAAAMSRAQAKLKDVTEAPTVDSGDRDTHEWVALEMREAQTCGFEDFTREGETRKGSYREGYEEKTFERGTYAYFHRKPKEAGAPVQHYVLTRKPDRTTRVTGGDLFNCQPMMDNSGKWVVRFDVKSEAQDAMWELTNNVSHKMAILYEDKVVSAPNLINRLRTGGTITMGTTGKQAKKEVDDLVLVLNAGALPGALRQHPVSEDSMEPTLGASTIRNGLIAIVVAYLAVIVFMCWYYRWAGIVASIALFSNLVLTIGFMVFVNAAFTLPGLAGLVLMLGMAVDSNVLIYERLREERERGASLALALRNAYDRALPTILDTHLTSIFTAIVLYVVGTDQLKGFGISLTVGLIISLFTTLHTARLLLEMSVNESWIKDFRFHQLFARPNFDFMRVRNYWFAGTLLLSIFGLGIFLLRGENSLSIDFRGGTEYSFKFDKPQNEHEVRKLLSPLFPDPTIGAIGGKGDEFQASTKLHFHELKEEEKQKYGIKTEADFDTHRNELPNIMRDRIIAATQAKGMALLHVKVDVTPLKIDNPVPAKEDERRKDKGVKVTFENKRYGLSDLRSCLESYLTKEKVPLKFEEVFVVQGLGSADEYNKYQEFSIAFGLTEDDVENPKAFGDGLTPHLKNWYEEPVSNRKRNIGTSWADEAQGKALMAIGLSWMVIVGYLWFRFGNWTFGVAAVLCLIHDLMFTIGLVGLSHYLVNWGVGGIFLLEDFKIDFPAVAALLTLVGYSVNDTIVVFDRIREVRGKNPLLTPQMINDSVNQTLSRTVLASLTTFLVVFVLYLAGGESIHLFSFVMVVGVVIGTYSSIFVASPLLLIFKEGAEVEAVPTRRQVQPATA